MWHSGLLYASVDFVVGLENFGFGFGGAGDAQLERFLAELRAARAAAGRDAPLALDFDPVRETLKAQLLVAMRRRAPPGEAVSVGSFNARLHDDPHPCMPGIPDDEVDLMFAALGERAAFTHGHAAVPSSVIVEQVKAAYKAAAAGPAAPAAPTRARPHNRAPAQRTPRQPWLKGGE